MGISIAYRGHLTNPADIDELTLELMDIAHLMSWKVWTCEQLVRQGDLPELGLRGATLLVHPRCEPVHIHADDTGRLVNHFYYGMLKDDDRRAAFLAAIRENHANLERLGLLTRPEPACGAEPPREHPGPRLEVVSMAPDGLGDFEEGAGHNWVKTQFGGALAHVAVCAVLKHVRQRYAPGLEVDDDTGFFAHGDLKQLEIRLAQVDLLLNQLRVAVKKAGGEAVRAGQPGGAHAVEMTTLELDPVAFIARLKAHFDASEPVTH